MRRSGREPPARRYRLSLPGMCGFDALRGDGHASERGWEDHSPPTRMRQRPPIYDQRARTWRSLVWMVDMKQKAPPDAGKRHGGACGANPLGFEKSRENRSALRPELPQRVGMHPADERRNAGGERVLGARLPAGSPQERILSPAQNVIRLRSRRAHGCLSLERAPLVQVGMPQR